ncbi:dermonecrotic toxin domain-containing protein [Burkholderia sp. AW49-1]
MKIGSTSYPFAGSHGDFNALAQPHKMANATPNTESAADAVALPPNIRKEADARPGAGDLLAALARSKPVTIRRLAGGENVEDTIRRESDLAPYLRDQQLLEQAHRDTWPDWRKYASDSDQQALAGYEHAKQRAQEVADTLLEDVESPMAYGRGPAIRYLKDAFGIAADPDLIRVHEQYATPAGIVTREGTLLEFLQDGPRDASRGPATYSVDRQDGAKVQLTDAQLKQTLRELDVRKDFGGVLDARYQRPDVKHALLEVLDSQIRMDAFSAKMRGHLSQAGYDAVQRACDPGASVTGMASIVSLGGVAINLPTKGADRMKDLLVFRESNARGEAQRYVLYAPSAPDGKDFHEFHNWRELSATVGAWASRPDGRRYLVDQLDPGNRRDGAYFFQDTDSRANTWRIDENGTATWSELPGNRYRDQLGAAVAEKSRTRVAEAKAGPISPDWYRHATATDRQQLTHLADGIRLSGEALLRSAFPRQSFAEYAHEVAQDKVNRYLREKGLTRAVDPDTVMVRFNDGTPRRSLTDLVKYGHGSIENLAYRAHFVSTTGQDLGVFNAPVAHRNGGPHRADFADFMAPFLRKTFVGEDYVNRVKAAHPTDRDRTLYREHIVGTMRYDALQSRLNSGLSGAEYASIRQQIDQVAGGQPSGTRSLHRLTLNGRPVEGTYVFRGVGEIGNARDLLYTPGAPDGRTFRPYGDAAFRQAHGEAESLTEAMRKYYYDRVKYTDQPVANTRLAQLQQGKAKPDRLGAAQQVPNLNHEYDRKLELMLDPVRETTKTRGQLIEDAVWKGISFGGTALSIVYPPSGIAFGALAWGRQMHDAYRAYRRGDRASASLHILKAGADALGTASNVSDLGKPLSARLEKIRKVLGLLDGQHFGGVGDAARALGNLEGRGATTNAI